MGQSVKASERGLARIDQARQRRGWTKTSTARWWQDAHTSRATLRRFWRRERIQQGAFAAICQTVGVDDWEAIADLSTSPPHLESPSPTQSLNPPDSNPEFQTKKTIDWGDAPDIDRFYDRAIELAQLHRWIISDGAKLIHLGGLGGIGKTTLAVALAEQLQADFEGVIWRSLNGITAFETVLEQVLDTPMANLEQRIEALSQALSQHRLLLILDVLEPSEDFWTAFHKVTSTRHQSCVVVICREALPSQFQARKRVKSLVLSGLSMDAAVQLLQSFACTGTVPQLKALARLYSYNPLALELVSATIQTVFGGRVAPFLAQDAIVLPEPILQPLSQQFESLTVLEQSLMFWLAIWQEPISLCRLQTHLLNPNPREVIQSLSRLVERSLISRHFLTDEPSFSLQPMVMAFVVDQLVNAVVEELRQAQSQDSIEPLCLLRTHCLIRPGIDDILGDRILNQLFNTYAEMTQTLAALVDRWGAIAQQESSHSTGYLIANLQTLKILLLSTSL